MKNAIRERIADAVDTLADLDALAEHVGDRLPPLLLARALVRLDGITGRLTSIRQVLADAAGKASAESRARKAPAGG